MATPSPELVALGIAICTLLTAAIGVFMAFRNKKSIQEIKISVDGRLEELLALTKKSSHAEGKVEGIAQEVSDDKARRASPEGKTP